HHIVRALGLARHASGKRQRQQQRCVGADAMTRECFDNCHFCVVADGGGAALAAGAAGTGTPASRSARSMAARIISAGAAPSSFSPLMNMVGVASTPRRVASLTDSFSASSGCDLRQACSLGTSTLLLRAASSA